MPAPISKKPYFLPSSETRIFLITVLVLLVTLNLYSSAKADSDRVARVRVSSNTLTDIFFMDWTLSLLDFCATGTIQRAGCFNNNYSDDDWQRDSESELTDSGQWSEIPRPPAALLDQKLTRVLMPMVRG